MENLTEEQKAMEALKILQEQQEKRIKEAELKFEQFKESFTKEFGLSIEPEITINSNGLFTKLIFKPINNK